MPALDRRFFVSGLAALPLVAGARVTWAATGPSHALSLYGDVKYPPDFTHFDYVNPEGAQRRARAGLGDRHLRQSEPLHPEGRCLRGCPTTSCSRVPCSTA